MIWNLHCFLNWYFSSKLPCHFQWLVLIPAVATFPQYFKYFILSHQKTKKAKSRFYLPKKRHLGCDNSRWRPDSWIWWAAALMMKRVPNLQYSWHLGKGKILIFWYFHRYRGTVIILSPSLSWQVPLPFCQSKPFDTGRDITWFFHSV